MKASTVIGSTNTYPLACLLASRLVPLPNNDSPSPVGRHVLHKWRSFAPLYGRYSKNRSTQHALANSASPNTPDVRDRA